MTLKEAVGKCGEWRRELVNQQIPANSVPEHISNLIDLVVNGGKNYSTGEFFIVASKKGYWVRGVQYSDSVDADICDATIFKIEEATGRVFVSDTFLGRPITIFKFTTIDGEVYYWNGSELLFSKLEDLQLRPIEPYHTLFLSQKSEKFGEDDRK